MFNHDLEDPSAKTAAAARRTQDSCQRCLTVLPRRLDWAGAQNALHVLTRMALLNSNTISMKMMMVFKLFLIYGWVHGNVGNARLAAAAVKKLRDKTSAKKANRAKGFLYLGELFEHQPCMDQPDTLVTYDMTGFLQQCLDRYVELAGGDVKFKKVSTPLISGRAHCKTHVG